ncbi:clpB2 [Scenedesmus sp. PABB004]|nr:clpB2 [Scenedesmus sp. PABB004]
MALRRFLGLPGEEWCVVRLINSEGDSLFGLLADMLGAAPECRRRAHGVAALRRHSEGGGAWEVEAQAPPGAGGTSAAGSPLSAQAEEPGGASAGAQQLAVVCECGVQFHASPGAGQKMGFYADQRANRSAIAALAAGKSVLDLCCFSGSFGLHAAAAGAAAVTGVDSSPVAVELATANAALNGLSDRCVFLRDDVVTSHRPPNKAPFPRAPSKYRQLPTAHRPVELQLNRLALGVVRPGGVLLTCSCSGAMTQSGGLARIVADAAAEAEHQTTLLATPGAAPDHPARASAALAADGPGDTDAINTTPRDSAAATATAGHGGKHGHHDRARRSPALRSPVTLSPAPGSAVLEVELTLRQGSVTLDTVSPGEVGNFLLFAYRVVKGVADGGPLADEAGVYPGPTLKVQPGQTLVVRIQNALFNLTMQDYSDPSYTPAGQVVPLYPPALTSSPYNNHVHGIHTSPSGQSDNVYLSIPPGMSNTYTYYIPTDHPSGLYWYHTHRHMLTSPQTFRGLAGMLVIGRADGYIPAVTENKLPIRVMAIQYNTVFDRACARGRRILNNPYWNSGINTSVVPAPGELAAGTYRPLLTPINFLDSAKGTTFMTAWWAGNLSVNNNRGKFQWMPQSLQTFTDAKGNVVQRAQPNADPKLRDVQFTINGQFQPTVYDTQRGQTEIWVLANMADAAYAVVTLTETATGNHPVISIVGQDGNPRDDVGASFLDGGRRLVLPPATRYAIAVTMPMQGDLVLEMPPLLVSEWAQLKGQLSNLGILYVNDGTDNPPAQLGNISIAVNVVNYFDGFFLTPTQVLLTAKPNAARPPVPSVPFLQGQPTNAYSSFCQTVGKPVAATRRLLITGGFNNELANPEDPNAFTYQFSGNQFPNIPLLQPRLDSIEEWTFVNYNNDQHPIHIHINDFQVTEIVDPSTNPPTRSGPSNYGQDNINVPYPSASNVPGSVSLRTCFKQYTGAYVTHCHRLNHEDNGLMAIINVIPARSFVAVVSRRAASGQNQTARVVVTVISTGDVGGPRDVVVADDLEPFPGYQGDLVTAMGDIDGDGVFDLVVGTKSDRRPRVAAWSGASDFTKALVQPFFLLPRASAKPVVLSLAAGGYVLGTNTSAISNVVIGMEGLVRVYDLLAKKVVSSFSPFGVKYVGPVSVATGQVTATGRTGIVAGSGQGLVQVFAYTLYEPLSGATEPQPTLLSSFSPFGDTVMPVALAAGWVAGDEGGFARIVASHPTQNQVKVLTLASLSRTQGHPAIYITPLSDYSLAAAYVEMANFTVPFVPPGTSVAVATASHVGGASLVVSAVGADVVKLTELVRPSPNATSLEPGPFHDVWVASGGAVVLQPCQVPNALLVEACGPVGGVSVLAASHNGRWLAEAAGDAVGRYQAMALRRFLGLPGEEWCVVRLINSEGDSLFGLLADMLGAAPECRRRAHGVAALRRHSEGGGAWEVEAQAPPGAGGTSAAGSPLSAQAEEPGGASAGAQQLAVVCECGVQFHASPGAGQKMGFYADQRANRSAIAALAAGKSVLDLCCFSGSFGLHAAAAGAAAVTGVDSSPVAVELATANAALNGLSDRRCARRAVAAPPPHHSPAAPPGAAAPNKAPFPRAPSKYRQLPTAHRPVELQLNRLALGVVRPGGVLLTCSCSGAMTQSGGLARIVADAAAEAEHQTTLLATPGAAPDHPARASAALAADGPGDTDAINTTPRDSAAATATAGHGGKHGHHDRARRSPALRSPVTLSPAPGSAVLEVELTLRQGSVTLDTVSPGEVGNFLLFAYRVVKGVADGGPLADEAGVYPGPTLKVQPGQTLVVRIQNALFNLTMQDYSDPSYTPAGQVVPHMLTSPQTFRGLAGMLVIGRADGYIPAVTENKLPIRVMAIQYNTVFDRACARGRRILNNPYWNSGINTSVVPAPGELAAGTYRPLLTPINFLDSAKGTTFMTAWWAGNLSVNNNRGKFQWMPQSLQTFTDAKGNVVQRAQPNADPKLRDVQFTINGQFQPTVYDTQRGQTEIWVLANMADAAYAVVTLTETATGNHPVISIVGQDGNPRDDVGASFLDGGRRLVLPPATRYAIAVTMPMQGDLVLEMPPLLVSEWAQLKGQLSNLGILYVNDGTDNPPAQLGNISIAVNVVNYFDGFFLTPTQVLLTAKPNAARPPVPSVPFLQGQPTNAYSSFCQTVGKPVAATRRLLITGGFNNELANPEDPNAFTYQFSGNQFPNIPLLQPRLDSIEEWTFVNYNNDQHPIHIHINDFQVTEIVDPSTNPPTRSGPSNYGQDNINVPYPSASNVPGSVSLRTCFKQYTGAYVTHCHRLNHEDNGLMAIINVIPARSFVAVVSRRAASGQNQTARVVVTVISTGDVGGPRDVVVADDLEPFPGYQGDLVTAMGDIDGDGVFDLVVGTKSDRRPRVAAWSGASDFTKALVQPFFLLPRASAKPVVLSLAAGGYVLGTNTSAISNVVIGMEGLVRVYDLLAKKVVSSFSPFGVKYVGPVSVATGQVTATGRTGIVAGSGQGLVQVFAYTLYEPLSGATEPQPTLLSSFSPFGDTVMPVALAAGWVAGDEGGFARIVASHPTQNQVKVLTLASLSRTQGHPAIYITPLSDYSLAAAYVEMANFTVPFVPPGTSVAVATASHVGGASLVVSSVGADVVKLTELVRPSPNATSLEPGPFHDVWVASGGAVVLQACGPVGGVSVLAASHNGRWLAEAAGDAVGRYQLLAGAWLLNTIWQSGQAQRQRAAPSGAGGPGGPRLPQRAPASPSSPLQTGAPSGEAPGEAEQSEDAGLMAEVLADYLAKAEAYRSDLGDKRLTVEHMVLAMAEDPRFGEIMSVAEGLDSEQIKKAIRKSRVVYNRGGADEAAAPEPGVLAKYSRELTAEAGEGRLDPVIGRHDEMRRLIDVLCRRTKNSAVLLGEPGVGKTAIVQGLAQRLAEGDVPEVLRGARLYALELGLLMAGATFPGEFEERLRGVLSELVGAGRGALLFIDDIHAITGPNAQQGGGVNDASVLLKPLLARGEVRVLGCTSADKYRKFIEKDPGLERRFQTVAVGAPSVGETMSILRGLRHKYEAHHGVRIADSALAAAAQLSDRYLPDRQLPDKAIDLMDEAAAKVKTDLVLKPEALDRAERRMRQLQTERKLLQRTAELDAGAAADLEALEEELARLTESTAVLAATCEAEAQESERTQRLQDDLDRLDAEIEAAEEAGDAAQAEQLRKARRSELVRKLRQLQRRHAQGGGKAGKGGAASRSGSGSGKLSRAEVVEPDVARIISAWTGIPLTKLVESEAARLLTLGDELHRRIIGQDEAVDAVAEAIQRSRAGMKDPNGPIASFLFLGPTGVGKTELAKALASNLFNTEEAMVRLDMSEYMEKHAVAKLIGAPPGYVGYDEGGQLTEAVRRRPYSVVLFDEVEKAHVDVFNLLLQLLDDGRVTDSQGRVVSFKHAIVILTSNLGSAEIFNHAYRAREQGRDADAEDVRELVMAKVRAHFQPEFLNRLDEFILFAPLSSTQIEAIVGLRARGVAARVAEKRMTLRLADSATRHLAGVGYDPVYGARPVKRAIQRELETPLAQALLRGQFQEFDTIVVEAHPSGEGLAFARIPAPPDPLAESDSDGEAAGGRAAQQQQQQGVAIPVVIPGTARGGSAGGRSRAAADAPAAGRPPAGAAANGVKGGHRFDPLAQRKKQGASGGRSGTTGSGNSSGGGGSGSSSGARASSEAIGADAPPALEGDDGAPAAPTRSGGGGAPQRDGSSGSVAALVEGMDAAVAERLVDGGGPLPAFLRTPVVRNDQDSLPTQSHAQHGMQHPFAQQHAPVPPPRPGQLAAAAAEVLALPAAFSLVERANLPALQAALAFPELAAEARVLRRLQYKGRSQHRAGRHHQAAAQAAALAAGAAASALLAALQAYAALVELLPLLPQSRPGGCAADDARRLPALLNAAGGGCCRACRPSRLQTAQRLLSLRPPCTAGAAAARSDAQQERGASAVVAPRAAPPSSMRIAVIGGGWYGCHLAAELIRLGEDVTVLEKGPCLFGGSSGLNQFRLHLGFHYPRSSTTRHQIVAAHDRFVKKYPNLFFPVTTNVYCISAGDSMLDFQTYKTIMQHDCAGVAFEEVDPGAIGLSNVEGALVCREGALLADEPKRFFTSLLHSRVRFGCEVRSVRTLPSNGTDAAGVDVDGEQFDWAVDCTYGQLANQRCGLYYEACLTLVYRRRQKNTHHLNHAFTVMDGPFTSLFPFFADYADAVGDIGRLHTLTHVTHTHMARFKTFAEARAFAAAFTDADAERARPQFEAGITHYLPSFPQDYEYHSYFVSFKTKTAGGADARETVCETSGRVISVMSGKVNTIFLAEDYVLNAMGLRPAPTQA